ncbi:hypothetical protein P3W45_001451 [Vairimorpha bombi]|jgi:phenylalanyl-tRNA synthetase beta chain
MPTISVKKHEIERLLNKKWSTTDFSDLLFDFGLEIDDVLEEEDGLLFKIEIPANRYDLLCTEGLSHSLKSYIFNHKFDDIIVKPSEYKIVKEHTGMRSCLASAIIKNYKFDKISFDSFISYQEKLCGSLGRNRSIVSIGTHDMDIVKFPVIFKSIKKDDLKFRPLNSQSEVTDLKDHFKNDKHISKYFCYTSDDKYIIFEDADKNILSIPPIINSEMSRISVGTTNIFIEVTGTNQHKVDTCLKMLLSAFRTDEMYSVEITGTKPDISTTKSYIFTVDEVYKELNINLSVGDLCNCLIKMMYQTEILDDKSLKVIVPSIRQDVIHKADIIEDIAIGYGYNNINKKMPEINTVGKEDGLNKFSDKIRMEMSMLGFVEVYTLVLVSKSDDIFGDTSALIDNYKSLECEVVRSSLYPGLLKSVSGNLHVKIPIKIFEVGDLVYLNKYNDVGASNKRFLSCLYVGNKSHLEDVQGPLSMILDKCGIKDYKYVKQDDEKKYLKNQSAVLKIGDEICGSIGVCNGDVLNKYKIPYSGSMFELDIQKIYESFFN